MQYHYTLPGRLLSIIVITAAALGAVAAQALTAPGQAITNQAAVSYSVDGTSFNASSNLTSTTVQELVDVEVTWLDAADVAVSLGATGQVLTFLVTNTGNGAETFALGGDSSLSGDDFDPTLPVVYLETDGTPGFSAGDTLYVLSSNDPALASEASVVVYLLNSIPGTASSGQTGDSALTATSTNVTGVPGTVNGGGGDGGTDAIVGASGGDDSATGTYVISDATLSFVKSVASIADPFGGAQPVPGAVITYRIEISVPAGITGTATAVTVTDPIPASTTYTTASLTLNTVSLSDSAGNDAGEYDSGLNQIVVRLGDLTSASALQTVEFVVTIN